MADADRGAVLVLCDGRRVLSCRIAALTHGDGESLEELVDQVVLSQAEGRVLTIELEIHPGSVKENT